MLDFLLIVLFLFVGIAAFVLFVSGLYKEEDNKHEPIKIVEPNDTWEARYYELVEAIWITTPEEAKEEYSYDEWHKDTLDEIKEMNDAVNEVRS